MASPVGLFDPELVPVAWFDPVEVVLTQFDEDLAAPAAAAAPVPHARAQWGAQWGTWLTSAGR